MMSLRSSGIRELVQRVDLYRVDANRKIDANQRSTMGQFLTPAPVGELMAGMFTTRPETVRLLDAGAGVGSLTAAYVAEACSWEQKPKSITVTAYEIEAVLRGYLLMTLEECEAICRQAQIQFCYEVFPTDFIAASVEVLRGRKPLFTPEYKTYNCAILNPPYHKISSKSTTRSNLRSIGIETSNLYAAFMWLVIELLDSAGELVSITPRSFCNGPYFRPFRLALMKAMTIRRLHVFESREEAFAEDKILQENVIVHAAKSHDHASQAVVTSSVAADDEYMTCQRVNHDEVVHPEDPDAVIHIIPDEISRRIGQQMRGLDPALTDLDLAVSTGRVVDFRAKPLLTEHTNEGIVPLIYPGNLQNGSVVWPSSQVKKPNAMIFEDEANTVLLPGAVYVLVKRFSLKEERRRVVAAVYDPERVPADHVGFENHVNYYHSVPGGTLSIQVAKGLVAFLNSTIVDQFFRQFSGHTQVNATDLQNMRYPSRAQLFAMGERIDGLFPHQEELDKIVREELQLAADPSQAKKRVLDAIEILQALGFPRAQTDQRSALTLLALLGIEPNVLWKVASPCELSVAQMIDFFSQHYGVTYTPNTGKQVGRRIMDEFVDRELVVAKPGQVEGLATSQEVSYLIEPSVQDLVRAFGSSEWKPKLEEYLQRVKASRHQDSQESEGTTIPATLPDGREIRLRAGSQSELIKKIIEKFCARFAPGGSLLWLNPACYNMSDPDLNHLDSLEVKTSRRSRMPDVIVHSRDKGCLLLIDAVTNCRPLNINRYRELIRLFGTSDSELVFVAAFLTRSTMSRYLGNITWETEVWVAESPEPLVHFDGEKFLGQ